MAETREDVLRRRCADGDAAACAELCYLTDEMECPKPGDTIANFCRKFPELCVYPDPNSGNIPRDIIKKIPILGPVVDVLEKINIGNIFHGTNPIKALLLANLRKNCPTNPQPMCALVGMPTSAPVPLPVPPTPQPPPPVTGISFPPVFGGAGATRYPVLAQPAPKPAPRRRPPRRRPKPPKRPPRRRVPLPKPATFPRVPRVPGLPTAIGAEIIRRGVEYASEVQEKAWEAASDSAMRAERTARRLADREQQREEQRAAATARNLPTIPEPRPIPAGPIQVPMPQMPPVELPLPELPYPTPIPPGRIDIPIPTLPKIALPKIPPGLLRLARLLPRLLPPPRARVARPVPLVPRPLQPLTPFEPGRVQLPSPIPMLRLEPAEKCRVVCTRPGKKRKKRKKRICYDKPER